MKIAICDDKPIFINKMKNLIRNLITNEEMKVFDFCSGDELLSSEINFDIVLLDIEMPGTDGLDVAAELYRRNKRTLVLFITSHREYSIKGYEFRAFRYVLKSEPDDFIKRNIQDAINEYKNFNFYITVNCKEEYTHILASDIIYIESFKHEIIIHTADRIYRGQEKLKSIYSKLKEHDFIQCYKSYIVNMRYIESIKKNSCVHMTNGIELSVGRKYRTETIESYLKFMDGRI